MRISSLILFFVFAVWQSTMAQTVSDTHHRIVFQLTDGQADTHVKFLRQLNNILEAAPNAQLLVVTHGMGVDLLKHENNQLEKELSKLKESGVQFVVCENTMKQRNLQKSYFLGLASYVPSAILEIVMRQEQGWTYIKAGG
jgi:uncharacterized protein